MLIFSVILCIIIGAIEGTGGERRFHRDILSLAERDIARNTDYIFYEEKTTIAFTGKMKEFGE